ncbi:Zn-dependent hydrolase [Arthrobacter livingstonensis]|uniref:Zn-dependent hydrolase n=1 Tax=Arthrobacter livingstonensis TaxID=670078 RepID=A0A2V5L2M6_9MICC|nr:MBL fold metallo-hydrolase [Arthrobacter livingstonensis]PYI64722.1 Zn-dependent hydrolase [Arthrobacter livingstonensis]
MTFNSPLIRELPAVTIRRTVVSGMGNNVYLITHRQTGAQVLIDAADELPAINRLIESAAGDAPAGTSLQLVATTHQHWDHVRALADLVHQAGVPTAAGRDDAVGIEAGTGVAPDRLLDQGDELEVGGIKLHAVHLRGHTPGSTAYVLEDGGATVIFSGDSLFPGGVGNTDKDPQRFTSLLNDVEERLFAVYGDDAVVLPGHGDATTLGAERPALPVWRGRGW